MLKVLPSRPIFNYSSQFTQSAELHVAWPIKTPGNAKHLKRFPVLPSSQSVEGKILKEKVHSASENLRQTLFFRLNSILECYNRQSKEKVAQNLLNSESEYLHSKDRYVLLAQHCQSSCCIKQKKAVKKQTCSNFVKLKS